MHEPDTWVGGVECNNKVTRGTSGRVSWHDSDITTWRVVKVKRDTWVVDTSTLCEDQEVVTVKMDWVWQRNLGLNDNVYPFAKIWHFDHWVASVLWNRAVIKDGFKRWRLPVLVKGRARERPLEEIGVATLRSDQDIVVLTNILSTGAPWDDWYETLVRLVQASWWVRRRG